MCVCGCVCLWTNACVHEWMGGMQKRVINRQTGPTWGHGWWRSDEFLHNPKHIETALKKAGQGQNASVTSQRHFLPFAPVLAVIPSYKTICKKCLGPRAERVCNFSKISRAIFSVGAFPLAPGTSGRRWSGPPNSSVKSVECRRRRIPQANWLNPSVITLLISGHWKISFLG